MSEDTRNWTADGTLGPIMRKKVLEAMSSLKREGQTFVTLTGVKGEPETRFSRTVYWEPFMSGPLRSTVADRMVRERFDYTLTKKNYKDVVVAYQAECERLAESRPVRDERREPEEEAEAKKVVAEITAEREAEQSKKDAVKERVRELAPAGTTRVIVAELKEDNSDSMTDYFSNTTVRSVAIGFSSKNREDFRLLHEAARRFSGTACYYTESGDKLEERRDNYSMGAGNYLTDHGWDGAGSGWVIKSRDIGGGWWTVDEIELAGEKVNA